MDNHQKLEQAERVRKAPYEPPKVTFVPLKLEERLLWCMKNSEAQGCANITNYGS